MGDRVLGLVSNFLRVILGNVKNNLWDQLWYKTFEYVIQAEEYWDEQGRGKHKKQWVKNKVLEFINEAVGLNWIQRRIASFFLATVIDSLIDTLNDQLGKDWIKQAQQIEENWKDKLLD